MSLTITQDGVSSTTGANILQQSLLPRPSPVIAVPDLPYGSEQTGPLGGVLYLCSSSLSVGDLVQGGVAPNRYVVPVTGQMSGPVLGVVVSKPRSIVAEVLQAGIAPVFSSLAEGARYYVGNDGGLTSLPLGDQDPLYVHYVGYAVASDTLLVQPSYPLVKRAIDG